MTPKRGFSWLVVLTVIAGGVWLSSRLYQNQSTVRLHRRTPLVGVVPVYRPAAPLKDVPQPDSYSAHVPFERIIPIEISEYAGYAGIIVANGGLQPSEDSLFFREFNFRVRLTVREENNLNGVNSGRLGATATTADVVAVYGESLNGVVPVLIGFSRGADGIVTRRAITSFGQLKGKVVATAQFSEAEFLVRYLATRTSLNVKVLQSADAAPDPAYINLVFAEDAFDACDMLLADLVLNRGKISGCAAWEPRTSGTVQRSGGAAHFLMTNRNLLVVADVLLVNRGLAEKDPDIVSGLVEGILRGNQIVRDHPETNLSTVGAAFNWNRDRTRTELAKVYLATMLDNLEFFSGASNDIGTFAHIYRAASTAYADVLTNQRPFNEVLDLRHIRTVHDAGKFPERPVPLAYLRPLVEEAEIVQALPAPEVIPEPRTLPASAFESGNRTPLAPLAVAKPSTQKP